MTAETYKEKGNAEFSNKNYEKAIEYYTYATEMNPKNHVYFTNRSMCYAAMEKWDKSLRDADRAISLNSNWEKGHYRRGVALQKLKQFKDAMEAFETCMKIAPTNEDFKKAYEDSRNNLFAGKTDAERLKIAGNELFKTGKISEAVSKYTEALNLCEGNDEKVNAVRADIYANRAACYVQLYEPTKVRGDCDAALKINPNHVKALLRRGQSLEALEKYKQALEDFDKVLRVEPNCQMAISAAVRLRNALRKQGQL